MEKVAIKTTFTLSDGAMWHTVTYGPDFVEAHSESFSKFINSFGRNKVLISVIQQKVYI